MRGLQKSVHIQRRPPNHWPNELMSLLLNGGKNLSVILFSPPGLTSLEQVLAPRGLTKKDWEPVNL